MTGCDGGGGCGGECFHILLLLMPVINASVQAVMVASVSGDAKVA